MKYNIQISATQNYAKIEKWCRYNLKDGEWDTDLWDIDRREPAYWYFKKNEDFVLFKLTWCYD